MIWVASSFFSSNRNSGSSDFRSLPWRSDHTSEQTVQNASPSHQKLCWSLLLRLSSSLTFLSLLFLLLLSRPLPLLSCLPLSSSCCANVDADGIAIAQYTNNNCPCRASAFNGAPTLLRTAVWVQPLAHRSHPADHCPRIIINNKPVCHYPYCQKGKKRRPPAGWYKGSAPKAFLLPFQLPTMAADWNHCPPQRAWIMLTMTSPFFSMFIIVRNNSYHHPSHRSFDKPNKRPPSKCVAYSCKKGEQRPPSFLDCRQRMYKMMK